jgi:hypothetical protein
VCLMLSGIILRSRSGYLRCLLDRKIRFGLGQCNLFPVPTPVLQQHIGCCQVLGMPNWSLSEREVGTEHSTTVSSFKFLLASLLGVCGVLPLTARVCNICVTCSMLLSSGQSTCKVCDGGFEVEPVGRRTCVACRAGLFRRALAPALALVGAPDFMEACELCPLGTVSTTPGSALCSGAYCVCALHSLSPQADPGFHMLHTPGLPMMLDCC